MKGPPLRCIGLAAFAATAAASAAALAAGVEQSLCDVAIEAVVVQAARHGLQAEVSCRPFVVRNAGSFQNATIADASPGAALRTGPTQWLLQVSAPGRPAFVQAVPVLIEISSKAWRLNRDVKAGELVRAEDQALSQVRWPIGSTPVPAGDAVSQGRARRALAKGALLDERSVLPQDEVARGDAVTVLVQQGDLSVRLPALVLKPARVGGVTLFQLSGRTQVLSGRLLTLTTATVGDEP